MVLGDSLGAALTNDIGSAVTDVAHVEVITEQRRRVTVAHDTAPDVDDLSKTSLDHEFAHGRLRCTSAISERTPGGACCVQEASAPSRVASRFSSSRTRSRSWLAKYVNAR